MTNAELIAKALEPVSEELDDETLRIEFKKIQRKCFDDGIEGWEKEKLIARHFAQWGAEHAKIDVTDFCKPIDPGIAQCIADHSWEMLGEDERPTPELTEFDKKVCEISNLCLNFEMVDEIKSASAKLLAIARKELLKDFDKKFIDAMQVGYIKGNEQAKKDLELTVKDIHNIDILLHLVETDETREKGTMKDFYEEVLRRFKETRKEDEK